MTVALVVVCAALLGLLCRQNNVRAYMRRAVSNGLLLLRQRRKGRHARAIPKRHLAWPKGNHVAFTDKPDELSEAAA